MLQSISAGLAGMGELLVELDVGVGLLVGVGASMSASHLFALLANRLRPRQILFHMVVDALVLSLAFLIGIVSHSLMLTLVAGVPLQPITFGNRMGVALWPGLFYVLVAAPYISDLIAVTLLAWVHLNVLVLLQSVYGVPLEKGLIISLPGYLLSLILIGLLFAQRWRASYNTLAREVASLS